jgi:hypothetical protein
MERSMKRQYFSAAGLCALFLALSAQAQPGPVPPPPGTIPQQPVPQPLPRDLQPFRQIGPLRPIGPQSTLPLESFETTDLSCSPGLDSATVLVNARLAVQPNPVTGNQATIEMLVDGVSTGVETLPIVDGAVAVSRRAPLAGAGGEHEVVFVLDGAVRSEVQPASHQCVARTLTVIDPGPGVLTLPNLAFGDLLYAQYARATRPRETMPPPSSGEASAAVAALLESRVSIGARSSFADPIIVRDLQTIAGRVQFPASDTCPGEIDAYVSATFAIAIRTTRVPDPSEYAQVIAGPFETPVSYVDTIDAPRWASGEGLSTHRGYVGNPLPQGYQWLVFNAGLECTRDGVLEIRFDPGNTLSESREDDNVLRIRYATVPQ